MSNKPALPVRDPGHNGPLVGGERMPVPHAEPIPVPAPEPPVK